MPTTPTTPLPSAPPAPEWDGCLTATPVPIEVWPSQSAAAVMAVAEVVVPSLPNERNEIEYAASPLSLLERLGEDERREHRVEPFTINGKAGQDGSNERVADNGEFSGAHGHHGRDATPGLRGEDGGLIDVSVSMTNTKETGKITVTGSMQLGSTQDNIGAGPSITTYYVPVGATTDFLVSAQGGAGGDGGMGGSGGNGATGSRGRNATRYSSGGNGGPGGDGGNAGAGSDGGDGGTGGKITIRVTDQDSYFLMAFPCCDRDAALHHAVRGGDPGREGKHGSPGMPGRGGQGGSSHSWTTTEGTGDDRKTVHHRNAGGSSGRSGGKGRSATHPLNYGNRGGNGKLTIHVDNAREYSYRYDLRLSSISIQSPQRLQELNHVFQFTDLIQITDMTCQNVGGMVSPIQGSNVHFKEQALFKHIIPSLDTTGWFPERLAPEGVGSIQGELLFRIEPPNIRELAYDMEPFRVKEKLYLGATQLGSYGFQRTYPNFHTDGIMMDFRFPVENQTKLEGLPTICAGDGMRVKFRVTNTSLRDLGVKSQDGRKLVIQFYKNGREEYDIASHHIDLQVEGVQCNSKLEDNRGELWRGSQFEIHYLKAGQTKTFEGTLKLSPQVTSYSRLAIQAEILLEELKHNNRLNEATLSAPIVIPVQRRQLEVSSEPTYVPSQENHAVLVSCSSTTKEQFNAWSDLLTRRLGLNVEYYSVSIYGSLDPDFRPPNGGVELAQSFMGKLVVVLDDTFNPLDESVSRMEPSRMIPNGSQSQTSGYDKSTHWLLAGSSDDAVKQALLSHFTAPPNDVTGYVSLSDFKKSLKEQLKKERKEGCVSDTRICESTIRVKHHEHNRQKPWGRNKGIDRKANAVKSFLEKMDPLRQYIVEPRREVIKDDDGTSYRLLVVRRGYCRTANTTNVLKRAIPAPRQNDGNAVLAVVGSLPLDTLHLAFANAVSAEDDLLLGIVLDTFTQHLLWEVANVLDGRLNVRNTEDLNAVFPTLATITLSSKLKQLASVSGTGDEGRKALSKLLARLECVANSRDLNPWSLPLSLRRAVRKVLLKMVATLKKEWAEITSKEDVLKEVQMVEMEVLNHLRKTYGFPTSPRVKSHSRWRKGLLHVCSYRNRGKYKDEPGFCGPTIRLCEMETLEYTKKSRAIAPSKTIATEHNCRIMRQQADNQKDMASQLLRSIKDTRDRQGLGNEGEFEVQLSHNSS